MNDYQNRFSSEDEDDDDHLSSLKHTTNFTKTLRPNKANELMNMNLDLQGTMSDNDENFRNSENESTARTGRSTASSTANAPAPIPKQRTFVKNKTKPPSRIDIDDDERDPFGKTQVQPSPRHRITTLRQDEEENQSFMKTFDSGRGRQSPKDIFGTQHEFQSQGRVGRSKKRSDTLVRSESDDESPSSRSSNRRGQSKDQQSLSESQSSPWRNHSPRTKDDSEEDHDDYSRDLLNQQKFMRKKFVEKDPEPIRTIDNDPITVPTYHSSSRPGSAHRSENGLNRKPSIVDAQENGADSSHRNETYLNRRPSNPDEQEKQITATSNSRPQSRPASAKSTTERQQTQSMLDAITNANQPPANDPFDSNNNNLSATSPFPVSPKSSALPPRPKSTGKVSKQKKKFPVPSQYKEIGSRIDSGRTPVSNMDLRQSVEKAVEKAMKTQVLQRPQSARSRTSSADSNDSRRRRRQSSAFENVRPKINTYRSINFDDISHHEVQANSSQSIKEGVYLEWAKAKEDEKRREKEEMMKFKEFRSKSVDKTSIERSVYIQAQKLEKWRQEKDEEMRKKLAEKKQLEKEAEEKKKQEREKKRIETMDGFWNWEEKLKPKLEKKRQEEEKKKAELEKKQKEKQMRMLAAEKAYDLWVNNKEKNVKKSEGKSKAVIEEKLKKVRQEEEERYLNAQKAYDDWLKEKEKSDAERSFNRSRRNSISGTTAKSPPVPFLPAGGPKNTGRVTHVAW